MKKGEALHSTRLLVMTAIAVAILGVCLMGLMSAVGFDRIGAYEDREVEYSVTMVKAAYQLKSAVTQQSAAVRGYLLTGDRDLLEPRSVGITDFNAALESLRRLDASPADLQALNELQRLHTAYRSQTERVVAVPTTKGTAEFPEAARIRDDLLIGIDRFIRQQERDIAAMHREVDRVEDTTRDVLVGTGLATAMLVGLLGGLVVRRVVVPLGDLSAATGELGAGQWHRRVPIRHPDEFGTLARNFNTMAGQIEGLVQRQHAANEELEAQAEALREQAEELQAQEEELEAQNEELRQQQDHLEETNEALHEANRYKDEFLSVVSHELRTPLTSTIGYTEFLEDGLGGPLTPDQERFVRQVKVGLNRVEHLVDDLLEFARLKAGTFGLRLVQADPHGTVDEVVESLRPQAEDAHLTLETHFEDVPEMVWMDPERIGQVLTNLIANAIKFTPAGGVIRVSAQMADNRLMCQVEDNGRGISPEDMSRLFQRFSQLEAGFLKGGSGLGLSICKALVEAHGGQIGVRSQPGQGTTFWFTVPVVDRASEPETNGSSRQSA